MEESCWAIRKRENKKKHIKANMFSEFDVSSKQKRHMFAYDRIWLIKDITKITHHRLKTLQL